MTSWETRAILAEAELERIKALLDTPEQEDFLAASVAEAKYQRTRWSEADAKKTDSEWFWLVGYLVSKAMHDVRGKRVHHLTAAGAALANWHKAALERGEVMPEERGDQADHTGRLVVGSITAGGVTMSPEGFRAKTPGGQDFIIPSDGSPARFVDEWTPPTHEGSDPARRTS